MSEQLLPSQIQINVTFEDATIHTNIGPGVVISTLLPENMIKDIYSQLMHEQKEQARNNRDIIRALKNERLK